MTVLNKCKTIVRRETSATVRSRGRMRAIIIELQPYTVRLCEKGMRRWFEDSWEAIYERAVTKAIQTEREAKKGKGRANAADRGA